MKLKFKKQKFQDDAARAVVDVFAGQSQFDDWANTQVRPYRGAGVVVATLGSEFAASVWGNVPITLNDNELLKNIQNVQRENNLLPDRRIETIRIGNREIGFEDKLTLTVEMETGTGKTYTYIQTMYDLYEHYGWCKFIVVVPSIAIREGVLKSFQITQDHFAERYGKKCRFFVYNSSRLTELEHYAGDSGINVMIINTQAFNATGKDARRIDMILDSFRSRRPIDVVAAVHPIVIIDEPQSVLGDERNTNRTREMVKKFNPLFFINYSATHREHFNKVYRLDAVDAYQQQLVKKITVKGIHVIGTTASSGYLYLQKINVFTDKNPTATVVFEFISKSSSKISKKVKSFAKGDNLYVHSGEIESYRNGYTISEINALEGFVSFTNGMKIFEGQCTGEVNEDDLRRIQIRETICSHLEKERILYRKGIKTLSLFFIDEVAKYKGYKTDGEEFAGPYAELFEREYEAQVDTIMQEKPLEEDKKYLAYLKSFAHKTGKIHAGYFSIDKKGRAVDSKIKRGESDSDDTSAYDLIMKNKERLLSLDEPVRFIFSHSALREGWDNPNVFQICTLRTGDAEIRKRQEIGRGLRLCVDINGERQDGELLGYHQVHQTNALTVIANESYEQFAKALQDEMAEVIRNRPKEVNPELFDNKVLTNKEKQEIIINAADAARIYVRLEDSGLLKENQLTDDYHRLEPAQKVEKIGQVLDYKYASFSESIVRQLDSVYDVRRSPMVENDRKDTKLKLDRKKFASREFKDLWQKINAKTYYTVAFSDEELITNCVRALNEKLHVTPLQVKIFTGTLSAEDGAMIIEKKKQENFSTPLSNTVKFDLIGAVTGRVNLTRKLVGDILQRIHPQTFEKFRINPEEFIMEAAKLIKAEKATTVIEHITYNKLNEAWNAEAVFVDNEISGFYGKNMVDARKHIYDKLRYDSEIERRFGAELDVAQEVELYVKLPKGFYIHTPMGKYTPDWAIVLKENDIKHIYFVAESKGASLDLQIREIENAKIACARRHFAQINRDDVKYDVVTSFEDLMRKIKG